MTVTIYTATTPVHRFTLPENASSYSEIQITYKQGVSKLVKHYQNNTLPEGMTFDGKKVIVTLSQKETKLFTKGDVSIHLRVLTAGGLVYPSQKWTATVDRSNSEDILE